MGSALRASGRALDNSAQASGAQARRLEIPAAAMNLLAADFALRLFASPVSPASPCAVAGANLFVATRTA
jgi:hypothetical protein